ncbi:MAG: HlyU family transcriptional regulator [Pseudomonadota bacterium]
MSFLKKLFGGGEAAKTEPETYQGFAIHPDPMPEGRQYRLQARIEKDIDGEVKTHMVIRADVFESRDAAEAAAITKAKQVIDEQGDQLFRA